VLGIFHAVVKRMARKRPKAFSQEIPVINSAYKTQVRHRMEERLRILYRSLCDQIGPQLTREVELGIHLQSFRNVDAAVSPLRRVIQFAKRRVTGASVVPRVRALLSLASKDFMNFYSYIGIKLFQNDGECGTHDASTDQNDIRVRIASCC